MAEPTPPQRKALVADDDALIRAMLSSELRSLGLLVVEAQNGEEAVDLWLKEHPDIMFLDLLMPKLNGLDALKRIREAGGDGHRVPAVLVTALTQETVRQFEISGIRPEGYLEKPFRLKAVARVLREVLGERGGAALTRLSTTIVALMLASALVPTVVLLAFGNNHWVVWPLFFALALTIGVGSRYARSLTQPLRDCVGQALNISRGIFGNEVPVRSRNEIGDLTHTFNYMSKQLRAFDAENRGLYQSLEQGYLETIVALANSIDSKDSYTRGHSQRVSELSVATGRELGLSEKELKQLAFGGILHDIGKIGIVERILLKQSRLTDEEMGTMREHPMIGAGIIEAVAFLAPVLPAVRNHHERWDGTGYPDRLRGDKIPLIARIVNVADTWDACTSTRPYQNALPLEEALRILRGLSGGQCDPQVVEALERVIKAWREAGRQVTAADSAAPQLRMA